MDEITKSLVDRIIVAKGEYDRELYTGFSHSRRDAYKAELDDARDALLRYVKQITNTD